MRGQCAFWMVSSCQSCLKFTASSFMYTGLAFAITHTVFRYSCHSNMKLTLVPTKTQSLFIKHFYIVHFPFAPSLHPSLFTSGHFSFFLFLFGRFNAFTPPLHSCGCFIHQSRHYSTNPTASSFAPLHLPLHHPPPSPTHGLSLEAYTLPAPLPLSSLLLSPWRSHSYSYFSALLWNLTVQQTHILYTVYIHTAWLLPKLGKVWKCWGYEYKNKRGRSLMEVPVSINKTVMMLKDDKVWQYTTSVGSFYSAGRAAKTP